jgi:SAM-dependent methyltransferase
MGAAITMDRQPANPCLERFYPESKFGGFSDIDGTITFYNRVNALINAEWTVLDIGCGRGAYFDDHNSYRKNLRILKGKVKQVIGIDIDAIGQHNPGLDIFKKIEVQDPWPVEDGSIDLALCDQVLEHIQNPELFFTECQRVLKPGGVLCIRTTNRWGYVGIGARMINRQLHQGLLQRIKGKNREADTFPTVFRCNTIRAIKQMLARHDFDGVAYGYAPEPGYFGRSFLAYGLVRFYQSICPPGLRSNIYVFAQKK